MNTLYYVTLYAVGFGISLSILIQGSQSGIDLNPPNIHLNGMLSFFSWSWSGCFTEVFIHQNFVRFLFSVIFPRSQTHCSKIDLKQLMCLTYTGWWQGPVADIYGEDSCFSNVFSPSTAQRRPCGPCKCEVVYVLCGQTVLSASHYFCSFVIFSEPLFRPQPKQQMHSLICINMSAVTYELCVQSRGYLNLLVRDCGLELCLPRYLGRKQILSSRVKFH